MTETDHCAENALAERVNGILKSEYGLGFQFKTKESARWAVEQAVRLMQRAGRIRLLGVPGPPASGPSLGGLRESRPKRATEDENLKTSREREPRLPALDPSPAFPPCPHRGKGIRMAYKSSWRVRFSRSCRENRWLALARGGAKGSGGPRAGRLWRQNRDEEPEKKWSKTSSGQRNRDRRSASEARR